MDKSYDRAYAALRFQPWKKTILDVNYEDGDQRRRSFARGFTYSDAFSAWTTLPAASRPSVTSAGSVLANTTFPGLDQLIAANTIFIVDGATPAVAPMNWARMGKTPHRHARSRRLDPRRDWPRILRPALPR